ncbi:hypothetical protein [Caulobacter endophyticus]|uniref:hypothetical protein n=1 Tax=Caulobacter endophyticus TaxID=2172652 RepID=UPI00240F0D7A|nr:hypothetical protein [Caulobacter endophyticus]MDG2527882.1 hypothetical protein [Caulobacter endophyticus]
MTAPPVRLEIGQMTFQGLSRPAALRAAAAFEGELARLITAGAPPLAIAGPGPVTLAWRAQPEGLGRALAAEIYGRIPR